MKALLITTAIIEIPTGTALLTVPALVASILLGAALDTPPGLALARVAGVALVALAVACWLARNDAQSRAARGVIAAMLLYNAGAVAVLAYAGLGLGLSAIGLWPAVLLHASLTAWCLVCLRARRVPLVTRPSSLAPLHLFAFALITALATGCGGFQASKSFSPLDFILPGLHLQNCPAPPVIPAETNSVPLLAQASHVPL